MAHEEMEREPGLAEAFREKLIRIGTMDRPLAVLTVLAVATVALCAALLLTNAVPAVGHLETSALSSLRPDERHLMDVAALAAVVVTALLLTLGWAYVIAGALHAHVGVRLGALAAYTFAIAVPAVQGQWPLVADAVGVARSTGLWGGVVANLVELAATLLPLALLWAAAAVIWLLDRAREPGAPHTHHRHHLKLSTFILVAVLVGLQYPAVVAGALDAFGHATDAIGVFGSVGGLTGPGVIGFTLVGTVAGQLFWVEIALILVLYMAGTDFAEWAEVVAGRAVAGAEALAGRVAPWLPGLAVAAVAASIVAERVVAWGLGDAAAQAVPALLVLLAMGAAAAFAIHRGASAHVPFWGLAAAAIAGYAVFQAAVFVAERHVGGRVASDTVLGQADLTAALVLWPPVALAGLVLVRRGGRAAAGGLLLLMCAVFDIGYLADKGIAFGHPSPPWVVAVSMDSVRMTVAALAVAYVGVLAVTRRLAAHRKPLRLLLILLLGLVGLTLLRNVVFQGALNAGERFTVIQAMVLLIALLWDMITSGEHVGNVHTRHLPRHARVLMYTGYIVLVATAVLWGSVGLSLWFGRHEGPSAFDSELWPQLGITRLGTPLLLTFFAANLSAWLARGRPAEASERRPEAEAAAPVVPLPPPPAPPFPGRGLAGAAGISLAGAVALGVLAVLTFTQAVPWMLNARATAPGLRAPATLAGVRIDVETAGRGEAGGGTPDIQADYGPPGAGLSLHASRAYVDPDQQFGGITSHAVGDALCSVDSGSIDCFRSDRGKRLTISVYADTSQGEGWTAPSVARAVDEAWAYELGR